MLSIFVSWFAAIKQVLNVEIKTGRVDVEMHKGVRELNVL